MKGVLIISNSMDSIQRVFSRSSDFSQSNDSGQTTLSVFFHEPQGLTERSLGGLFFVSTLPLPDRVGRAIAEDIFALLKDSIYRLNQIAQTDDEREELFAQGLKHANSDVLALLRDRTEVRDGLALAVGLFHPPMVVFTTAGVSMRGYSVFRGKFQTLPVDTQLDGSHMRLFHELTRGSLSDGDSLLLSTFALPNYLHPERLQQLPDQTAPEQLASIQEGITGFVRFGGACIALQSPPQDNHQQNTAVATPQRQSERSLRRMLGVQDSTQQYLASSTKRDLRRVITLIGESIRRGFLFLRRLTVAIRQRRTVQVRASISRAVESRRNLLRHAAYTQAQSLRQLNQRQRYLIIGILAVLFLFSQSVIRLGQRQQSDVHAQNYQQELQQLTEKKNSIDANLLVQNYSAAQDILSEADELLGSLSRSSREKQQTYERLVADFNTLRDRVSRKTNVANLRTIISTSALLGSSSFSGIEVRDQKIVLLSHSGVATLGVDGQQAAFLGSTTPVPTGGASAILAGEVIYPTTEKLATLQKNNEVKSQKITLPADPIISLAAYENNFYALAGNQIYKWRLSNSDYTAGSGWVIGDRSSIGAARSLAVDGSVYVLLPDSLKKYVRGVEQKFSLEAVSPAMRDAVQVYAQPDFTNIYILEPTERRLLAFAKSGALIQQYFADAIAEAISFRVQEKEGQVFVLTKSSVINFPLSQ